MARPKKELDVNGNTEQAAVLTDKAYGIHYNKLRNKFQFVEISYNGDGEIGDFKVLEESEGVGNIQTSFKVAAGRLFIESAKLPLV
jgi:hypothetical protein